ncbi:MAG: FG-GAP-like repeat-containing protein [Pseudomonadota bacterium]
MGKTASIRSGLGLIILAVALLGMPAPGGAAEEIRVAVVPFEIHGPDNLEYLREALSDMFASRLGGHDIISVVAREQVLAVLGEARGRLSTERIRAIGLKTGASHVLHGSLTVVGDSLSLDACLVEMAERGGMKSFSAEGKGLDTVISNATRVAADVARFLSPEATAPPEVSQEAHGATAPSAPAATGVAIPAPGVPAPKNNNSSSPSGQADVWRSRPLPFDARGLALADIDGDRHLEVLLLDSQAVHVYRLDDGNLAQLETWKASGGTECLTIDAADLDRDGRAEIYVSALNNRRVASFVLRQGQSGLEKTVAGLDYYLRVVDWPEEGRILIGQAMDNNAAFRPGIFKMEWNGRQLERGREMTSDPKLTIFNSLPVKPEGGLAYLAILSDDLLHLRRLGEEQWRSSDYYAGSHLYIDVQSRKTSNDEAVREYLPQRLLPMDGGRFIAAVVNKGSLSRWLKKYKNYSGGELRVLSWNPQGLSEAWRSPSLESYIADISYGDADGDGTQDLLAAVVLKPGWSPFEHPRSGLVLCHPRAH